MFPPGNRYRQAAGARRLYVFEGTMRTLPDCNDPAPPVDSPDLLAALIVQIARGDHAAFTDFYHRTSRRVFGTVRRILLDPTLSEEVAQEVFLDVWQHAAKYSPSIGAPAAWLMTIAHHKAVDKVRSHQSSADRDQRWAAASHSIEYDEVLESVTSASHSRALMRSLAQLSEVQREAIVLAYFGCLTYREVAEKLSKPLPTIKTRIRDGLQQLRAQAGDDLR